jgi:purine-binding chemotaxis protein CheW
LGNTHMEETIEYLSFQLGEELFAIEVSKVREVLEYTTITRVPGAPDFMKGVINVRGGVVPVMDLKNKLNMPESETGINTRIVVMELMINDEKIVVGSIADTVHEVMALYPGQIQAPPKLGSKLRIDFTKGILEQDDKLIIILDIERIAGGDNALHTVEDTEKVIISDEDTAS